MLLVFVDYFEIKNMNFRENPLNPVMGYVNNMGLTTGVRYAEAGCRAMMLVIAGKFPNWS